MATNWRISSFNGALLAAYFIPAWSMVAYHMMFAPVHALYELPNISAALYVSDQLHMSGITLVRLAWLLALSRIMVIAFFAIFVAMLFVARSARPVAATKRLRLRSVSAA